MYYIIKHLIDGRPRQRNVKAGGAPSSKDSKRPISSDGFFPGRLSKPGRAVSSTASSCSTLTLQTPFTHSAPAASSIGWLLMADKSFFFIRGCEFTNYLYFFASSGPWSGGVRRGEGAPDPLNIRQHGHEIISRTIVHEVSISSYSYHPMEDSILLRIGSAVCHAYTII